MVLIPKLSFGEDSLYGEWGNNIKAIRENLSYYYKYITFI